MLKRTLVADTEWIFTSSGKIRLLKEGIIHVHINPGHLQTPENAHENLGVAKTHCHTVQRRVLLDLRGAKPLPKETRAVYSDRDIAKYFIGLALVVKTDKINKHRWNPDVQRLAYHRLFEWYTECRILYFHWRVSHLHLTTG